MARGMQCLSIHKSEELASTFASTLGLDTKASQDQDNNDVPDTNNLLRALSEAEKINIIGDNEKQVSINERGHKRNAKKYRNGCGQ